jgi:hypothetical protein
VRAYPTAVFVDRTGRVRRIHAGFVGPAAGVHYTLLVDDYRQTLEALLAEPPPAPSNPGNS